jgi:hypothetical protein
MVNRRKDRPGMPAQPKPGADPHDAVMVAPVVNILDKGTGDKESLWVWELED